MTLDPLKYTDKSVGGDFSRSDAAEVRTKINELIARIGTLDLTGAEVIDWNDDFKTLNIVTGTGSTLQVGQEFYFLIYNNLASPITNGQIVKPTGGIMVGDNVIPTVILAQADNHETCDGTLFWATSDIAVGELGMATRLGRVNDVNTEGMTPGASIYLSPTVAGGFTTTRPEFPDYVLSIGGVLFPHATLGQVGVSFTRRVEDTILDAWDGSIRETFDFLISSDGATITGSLERSGGGDVTLIFSDGLTTLDTTPAATIALTPGTDTVPIVNYVYILKSTKALTISTSGWPTPEHIKIADVVLASASHTQTDGAFANRNWNDHIKTTGDNGHLLHIAERLRQLPSAWESGAELSVTIDTGPTPDDVFIDITEGLVYQLHIQTFDAFDLETGSHAHIRNHATTPYLKISNLNVILNDSLGVSLNNTSFSLVFWGVITKTGEEDHVLINLPSGSYAYVSPDDAETDAFNYADYTIPKKFNGKAFLIARGIFTYKNDDWTIENIIDLRGRFPNNTVGS